MKTTLTRFRHLLGLSVLGCMAHHANANVVTPITYLWTGNGSDNNLYTPENWENNQPPPSTAGNRADDITDTILRFGPNTRTYVEFNDLYAHQLLFDLIDTPFVLNGWNGGTVHLGSGGITYNPAATNYEPWSRIEDNIALHASQTWNITDGILEIYGGISDNLGSGNYGDYQVEKTGDGELRLNAYGSSDWSGGLKLSGGKVVINTSYTEDLDMLGYGPLTFAGGALELHSDYFSEYYTELSLNNDLISQGVVAIHSDKDLLFSLDSDVFRLDADTTLRFSGGTFTNLRDIEENETAGALSLTIDSNAAIAHYGASFWTGGTLVDRGVFIFGGENNLPETGTILVGEDGYVGIGDSNSTANFIGQIDLVNSTGTIGFDSDPESATGPDTFTDTINLTGANSSLRLGSATQAILGDSTNFATSTEQIIVGSTEPYRFGGGGGSLFIASLLTDGNGPRSVEVHSIPELPLTVWLLNPNNAFTGGVDVDNSALIFGSGALPNFDAVSGPNAVVNGIVGITTTATGYVGTGDHNLGQDFFAYFPTDTPGIIGFDVFPGDQSPTSQTINDLDTSRFTAAAIGSSSSIRDTNGNVIAPGLELTGNLIPNADGTHRFAAYKGGLMAVPGNLTGNRLIIGRPDSIATFGDRYSETYSTVVISGDNDGKLQNGTTLF
ncbi:MAG: hypothetical protein IT582_02755, partial [Opitutaceae bacterium]|nr:hypothetical protein [Opitutaceae bacterium]